MIALDTNVLVRSVVLDNAEQAAIAKNLLMHPGGVFIAKTVLLEFEWVLRSAYRYPREPIHLCILRILGLPMVTVEAAAQVAQALKDFALGMDFADALHLASVQTDEGFYTFDEKFAKLGQMRLVKLASKSPPV